MLEVIGEEGTENIFEIELTIRLENKTSYFSIIRVTTIVTLSIVVTLDLYKDL